MARNASGFRLEGVKWEQKTKGSGTITPLSYKQQLCREILHNNERAKAAIEGKKKQSWHGKKHV